jgi:hypothetical protein
LREINASQSEQRCGEHETRQERNSPTHCTEHASDGILEDTAKESSAKETFASPPPNDGGIDPEPLTVFSKACNQATLISLRWESFQLPPAVR